MSEKILPFESEDKKKKRLTRDWESLGSQPDELEFEFVKPGEESLTALREQWQLLIAETGLSVSPVSTPLPQFDGVSVMTDNDIEKIRQSLVYHYRQMVQQTSVVDRVGYWSQHPEIAVYLARADQN